MRSFDFWPFLGLLSTGISSVSAAPGSGAKLDRDEHSEEIHSPSFWSGNPKTHAYTWKSERTSFSPVTSVWFTDTTVAHTTTICPPSPGNSTVIASDASTISWKLTSTTTYSTTLTYEQSSITTSPPPNPCPTSCKVSAGTVNLFYWPTDQPYDYPTTHFDEHLDYTFTSPSVYMIVDKIYGTNTAGDIVGPSGTSVIFPLDLDEVSTIVPNISATHQLTLNDLHTDCPQTEEASVIATKVAGGPCDPILAAPKKVKSWASPCGACQNFGLFDPPYAVAPLTGGLVPMTTTTVEPAPQTTTTIASATETTIPDETTASTTSQSNTAGVAVTLTESSGSFVAIIPVTIPTSSNQPSSESSAAAETATEPSMQTSTSSPTSLASPSSSPSMGASPSSSIPAAPAAAAKLSGGLGWIMSLFLGMYFL